MSEASPAYATETHHTATTCASSIQTTSALLVSSTMKWYIDVFIKYIPVVAGG
jgi:hypothetical protein